MSMLIDFIVGGVHYAIHRKDIEKYPDSYLAASVKKEWHSGAQPISVDRSGELFRYIYAFLVAGSLAEGLKQSLEADGFLEAVEQEAEYFGLPQLVLELSSKDVVAPLNNYNTIRKFVKNLKRLQYVRGASQDIEVDYFVKASTDLLQALGTLWAPFCLVGKARSYWPSVNIFMSTTIAQVNVPELLDVAAPSPFGRGTETVFDPTVRSSLEIPAELLDQYGLNYLKGVLLGEVAALCTNTPFELRPYKLVIYQEGGHFDQHRDTVRGEGHIGTLVLILNSAYTGGELEITHGGRTEVVTGPYHWVAMYGDCLHKINPVTSGTRVSLIFDIYAKPAMLKTPQVAESFGVSDANVEAEGAAETGHGGDGPLVFEEVDDLEEQELLDVLRSEFWGSRDDKNTPDPLVRSRGADGPAIRAALDAELAAFPTVVICLQHMYPACQAVPGFLKGTDDVLYGVLTEDDRYEVQVVYCAIHRSDNHWRVQHEYVHAELFTSISSAAETVAAAAEQLRSRRATNAAAEPEPGWQKTKLVIPAALNPDSVLDYTPYIDHTGNESQAEETVYVVTGLQVRRRE